ncbi:MAG: hypothetical protein AOA65_0390 [Candidatus Bathyarchaeota archaeon BA1]|nr:MAG: hypothetical protein AOA65_0390 [Candidatus Bathyarchaeota archaeon BA1]
MKTSDLKSMVEVLRDLGLSYEEALDAMSGVAMEMRSLRRLWRLGNDTTLIKLGLALIAFSEPIVSDVIGAMLVSAGILQIKMRRSTLYIDDVHNTFQVMFRELQTIKHGLGQ